MRRKAEGRFEALRTASLTPLVGCKEELAALLLIRELNAQGQQRPALAAVVVLGLGGLEHPVAVALAGDRLAAWLRAVPRATTRTSRFATLAA